MGSSRLVIRLPFTVPPFTVHRTIILRYAGQILPLLGRDSDDISFVAMPSGRDWLALIRSTFRSVGRKDLSGLYAREWRNARA